jgi:hypothetical protein
MLVANSIVLAFIGLIYDSENLPRTFKTGLTVVGLLFCLIWFTINARGFGYHAYWLMSAREIEETYLSPAVQMYKRGADFSGGARVEFSNGKTLQMKPAGRLRAQTAQNLITACFTVLYGLLLVGQWL